MATSAKCCVCQDVVQPGNRRTLNPEGGESNRRVYSFLHKYAGRASDTPPQPGPACFICRHCFAEADKGSRAVESGLRFVNSMRKKLNLQEAEGIVQCTNIQAVSESAEGSPTSSESSDIPDSPISTPAPSRKRSGTSVVSSPKKKPRRSLQFTPLSKVRGAGTQSSPLVQVRVSRADRKKAIRFRVASRFKALVQSTRYKKSPYTARTALRTPTIRKPVINALKKHISRECALLCRRRRGDSLFRLPKNVQGLKSFFDLKKLKRELKHKAPILYCFLRSACVRSRDKNKPNLYRLVFAAAVLLKERNQTLCLMQAIVSVLLYSGHCSKMAITRLNKLGLCLSHFRTVELIKSLGNRYDQLVRDWKKEVESVTSVSSHGTPLPFDDQLVRDWKKEVESVTSVSSHGTPLPFDGTPLASHGTPPPSDGTPLASHGTPPPSDGTPLASHGTPPPSDGTPLASHGTPLASEEPPGSSEESTEDSEISNVPGNDIELSTSSSESDHTSPPSTQCKTCVVIGDNWDKTINPCFMTMEHQRKSLHYSHSYAAFDRIDFTSLTTDKPIGEVSKLIPSLYLPSAADCNVLRDNYATMLARVLIDEIDYFRRLFGKAVTHHIPHQYSVQMQQKSPTVPLGIIPKNENKTDELIQIMEELYCYVPAKQQIPFAGDQLTAARARTARRVRVNCKEESKSLRGFVPFAADWHCKVNLIEMIWSRLYKLGSSKEGGTLVQLRNLINRKNVGSSKEVKHHVNEVEDFLEVVVKGHLVAAALHHFGMADMSDVPHLNGFPSNLTSFSALQRKKLLMDEMKVIIDEYVVPYKFSENVSKPTPTTHLPNDGNNNPHLLRITAEHDYIQTASSRSTQRRFPSTIQAFGTRVHASQSVKATARDDVYHYASAVLNDGLLLLEFKDAIREGDGPRILRVWRVLMLYFHHAGHKNYLQEAFQLTSMVNATASPRIAAQLTWSRVVNLRGGSGHNVPVDLCMEHLNRTVKDYVAHVGANIGEKTILQSGKSLSGIMKTCKEFDTQLGVSPQSVEHSHNSSSDIKTIVKELVSTSKVFDYIPGREHKTFKGIQPNVASCVNISKLFSWIEKQKKKLRADTVMAKAYGHKL